MCEAFEGEIDEEDVGPKLDEDYILEPFPNDQFIPDLGGVIHKYVSVSRGFNRRDFLIPFFTYFLHTEGCHLKGVFTVE